jgi:succinate dehydrogenase / fumarate reductase iron-sulfur subunit
MQQTEDGITLRVKRQNNAGETPYWEEFTLPDLPNANVITCLQYIQRHPVNAVGQTVAPVVWECSCLEEVCGACTMVINGEVRQSCTALVSQLGKTITLEPAASFPVVRDLAVDRSRMFEALKKTKCWVEVDGYHDLGPGSKIDAQTQQESYRYSTCMTCGCCLEACPQVSLDNDFVGPSAIGQVKLFNTNPSGQYQKDERLAALQEEGGIYNCGNAQNCVEVCPKSIPLTEAIASVNRQMAGKMFRDFFGV